jgi:DNA-binding response OmpR family regulator
MKLLIIEDERKLANALKQGFNDERFVVEIAYDGDDGLSYALAEEYDCIIIDRMLPGKVDGLAICQELRDKNIKTPILILTAKSQVRDKIEGLNNGADDYMTKPFSFEELLARVRALLRRPHETLNPDITVEDLTLTPIDFSVKRAGVDIKLTATEFSLLEYMMRNKGRVLSKTNIMSHVWDFDADILPNTVEAYIGYLRAKIDKAFENKKLKPLIHTVRGFGYKIGENS